MLGHQFAQSVAPIRQIKEVQFGILSPDEIKAYSVAKIEFPEVLDDQQKQKEGGLADPRMGTIDRNFKCATCGEGMAECPGHFGHIELARPVFHVGFLVKVKKILESICVNCGKLKADLVSFPIILLIHFLGALFALRAENPEPAVHRMISVVAQFSTAVSEPCQNSYMSPAVGLRLRGEKESWVALDGICVVHHCGLNRQILLLCRSKECVLHPVPCCFYFLFFSARLWRSRTSIRSLTGNLHINGFSRIRRLLPKLSRRAIIQRPAWPSFGPFVKAR